MISSKLIPAAMYTPVKVGEELLLWP